MATIPATYAQAVIPFTHTGLSRSAAIVFGVLVSGGFSDAATLADEIQVLFENDCLGLIDNQVTVGPTHVAYNDGTGIFSGDGTVFSPGGLNDATLPPNCAVLLKKSSNHPGRAGRGRLYLPWAATESSVSEGGALDPAAATVIGGAFEDWRVAMENNDTQIVILHAGAGTPAPVTAFSCDLTIATQRRRLR